TPIQFSGATSRNAGIGPSQDASGPIRVRRSPRPAPMMPSRATTVWPVSGQGPQQSAAALAFAALTFPFGLGLFSATLAFTAFTLAALAFPLGFFGQVVAAVQLVQLKGVF